MSQTKAETRTVMPLGLWFCGLLALAGLVLMAWRFWGGLGAVSHLSDGRPWGLWISLDVYCGVALAAGGFGLTAAVYVLGMKQYYSLARSAVLTAMLGYLMVLLAVAVDTGQPWRLWHVAIFWNPSSPLFEVGWCVMLYTSVLVLEFSPDILARFHKKAPLRLIRSIEVPLAILGIALATMHQSSLGTALLLAPYKLHGLWYTPLLPVLFFLSALPLGLAVVIAENSWQGHGGKVGPQVLDGLARALAWMLGLYLAVRLGGLAWEGKLDLILGAGHYSVLFWAEMLAGCVVPLLLFANRRVRASRRAVFSSALLMITGMVLGRLNASLLAFSAVPALAYLPSWEEYLISVGIMALGLLGYIGLRRLLNSGHDSISWQSAEKS